MSDISEVSGPRKLTSQIKASFESMQTKPQVESACEGAHQIERFEAELQQVNHAFALMKEIRYSLESALRDLSPNN